jgi:hypothetical protein
LPESGIKEYHGQVLLRTYEAGLLKIKNKLSLNFGTGLSVS